MIIAILLAVDSKGPSQSFCEPTVVYNRRSISNPNIFISCDFIMIRSIFGSLFPTARLNRQQHNSFIDLVSIWASIVIKLLGIAFLLHKSHLSSKCFV